MQLNNKHKLTVNVGIYAIIILVVNLTANKDENLLSVSLGSEKDTPSLVRALVEYGVGVRYVKPLETSLEEAYLELMEEEK